MAPRVGEKQVPRPIDLRNFRGWFFYEFWNQRLNNSRILLREWYYGKVFDAKRADNFNFLARGNFLPYFSYSRFFCSISGGFLGDIALPNIKYETEWRQQKLNKSFLEELEKYRDEVLKEGLQVEEEGLTGKKEKRKVFQTNETSIPVPFPSISLAWRSRISYALRIVSEILQFKNGHDANEPHQENEEMVASQEKSEPIMVDRNQYSMDGELEGGFSFNARNEDARPGVRDEGVEFRYVAPRKFHVFFFLPFWVPDFFLFFFQRD